MDSCVDKLKCSNCNNHLSYFPIYLLSDKKNICGRCESTTKDSPVYIRNEMYEILAQFLKFPCRYQGEGCQKELTPSEVPIHEKSCVFRVGQCPTESITGCVEEVPNRDLIQHCQEKHSDLILKDYKFEIDLSHSYEIKNLLLHEDTLFIVTKNFCLEDNTFQCLINNHENENNSKICRYQINFTNDNSTISSNCVVNDCKSKKVCLDMFKNCDDDGFVVFCEIIIQNTKKSSNSLDTYYKNVHDQLLVNLKCPSCTEYLMPPFSWYDQNVLCSRCNVYNGIRLNEIATFLNYPCSYQKNGCNFTCTSAEMENHKIFCSFANCECPVNEYTNCTWEGLSKEVMEHIKEDHHDIILECPARLTYNFSDYSTFYDIIKFSNRLFRLVTIKNGSKYIWSLQLIGHFTENYKYEIEIINNDENDDSRKLQMRQPCPTQPLLKDNQIRQNENGDYSYFDDNQIQNLSAGQPVTCILHILT